MKTMQILTATDGEPHSTLALHNTAALARSGPCTVTLLMVIGQEAERPHAEQVLEEARGILATAKVGASTLIKVGHAAEEIVQEAARGPYDLIVLGQRPTHGLLARLFGPVTQQVVEQAAQPVLIAKEQIAAPWRLLICDSGMHEIPLLDRFMERLPQLLDNAQDVTVLHVMSQIGATPGISGRHLRATAEELIADQSHEGEMLERDLEKLEQVAVQPQPLIRHGLVVDEIVDEAQRGQYDLAVIGAHRQESLPRFLLDDLAGQIIEQIERSVVVIQ